LLTLGFLTTVFLIFTAFELWKFAGTIDGGITLLVKYLFFLLPFVYIQLAPSAAMIATLATYVIKSRQNEIVTWTSAGMSVYRLLLPCLVFMFLLGVFNWQVQEQVAASSNQRQDELRTQIRSRGTLVTKSGKFWVANDRRIHSFEMDPDTDGRNGNCV
jgi:lipopolysaccharide export system permease protein